MIKILMLAPTLFGFDALHYWGRDLYTCWGTSTLYLEQKFHFPLFYITDCIMQH